MDNEKQQDQFGVGQQGQSQNRQGGQQQRQGGQQDQKRQGGQQDPQRRQPGGSDVDDEQENERKRA